MRSATRACRPCAMCLQRYLCPRSPDSDSETLGRRSRQSLLPTALRPQSVRHSQSRRPGLRPSRCAPPRTTAGIGASSGFCWDSVLATQPERAALAGHRADAAVLPGADALGPDGKRHRSARRCVPARGDRGRFARCRDRARAQSVRCMNSQGEPGAAERRSASFRLWLTGAPA
eukprot:3520794-Rhodomonas_salina.2